MKIPSTLGRYEVTVEIGRGGMGRVYRAHDPLIGRDVAIKLLRDGFDNPELRNRFAREARSAGSLSHPNIVAIYDIGEHSGRPFIAMEFVPGDTFADLIKAQSPLSVARKVQMVEEVCAGLAHAHEAGIVHRDIKPPNLMVGPEGIVKILDFGIARLDASGMTQPGTTMGTLNYMAPEQANGEAVDARADIFAVGAVLYELLSYHQAFPGQMFEAVYRQIIRGTPTPVTEYCPDLHPNLLRILDRALQKDPAQRFQTAESMQKELAATRRGLADARGSGRAAVTDRMPVGKTPAADLPTAPPRARLRRPDRASAAALRTQQLDVQHDAAERAIQGGNLDAAIDACEQMLRIDAAEPRAAALIDRIHAAIDERQAQTWLSEARQQMEIGSLAAASDLLESAREVAPDDPSVANLAADLEEARANARSDAVARAVARARAALATGDVESAGVHAREALAFGPAHADAFAVQDEVSLALETRSKDAAVRAVIDEARRHFLAGEYGAAISRLQSEAASHSDVADTLAEFDAVKRAIDARQRQEEARLERQRQVDALVAEARLRLRAGEFAAALKAVDGARGVDSAAAGLDALGDEIRRAQAAAQLNSDIDEAIRSIDARLAAGDLAGAERAVQSAASLAAADPRVRSAHDRYARAAAERAAVEAAEARAREVDQRLHEAKACLDQGDPFVAERLLSAAQRLDPRHPQLPALLARTREALDRKAAEEAADEVRRTVAELVHSASQELHAHGQPEDLERAIGQVDQAVSLDPSNTRARSLRPALESALAASRREDTRIRAAVNNARRRAAAGKYQAAIQLLEAIDPPNHPLVVEAIGEVRAAQRDDPRKR